MKKKALILLNRLVVGGQTLDTIPLLYHLKDEFDILVLYGCKEKDEMEAAYLFEKFDNISLIQIKHFKRSINPVSDVLAFFSILRAIRKFKPDIVHTHGLKSGLMGRPAAYVSSVGCIIHTFHGHHFHSYFNSFISKGVVLLERGLGRITTKIVAISTEQKKELVDVYKIVAQQKIEVIPLGIDEKLFVPGDTQARSHFREKYGLAPGTIAVGIIGRIVPVKNYMLFINVICRTIPVSKKEIKFFVIGDGGQKAFVQQELTHKKITWDAKPGYNSKASVIFTSWIPEVTNAMNGLDIIVLTSHNEGTPMSLIEAQFCGKPVVATDVGGVKDTFLPGKTGFLVPPGDAEAFAEGLLMLAEDDTLRVNMGSKAAVFAAANFSKTKEVNSFRAMYQFCNKHNIQ